MRRRPQGLKLEAFLTGERRAGPWIDSPSTEGASERGTGHPLVNLSGTPDSEDIHTRIPSELLMSSLLKTPLHALHVELGAKMVPFAGYDMPVQYPTGVMA